MAYVPDLNDQNAPQQLQGNQVPTSSGVGSNTSAGGSPQGSTAVPATTQAPPVQNLQAYLTANAPQAVQMGQNIANNLNQTAGNVSGDINNAQTNIGNQVQKSNVTPNQDLINQAAANPSGFVQDPNNVAQFQQQENANYTGPTSFESTPDSQALTNEVASAQQQAPDVNQPQGYQQLARGQEKNPTTGMSNLDALLLQENPEANSPIQAAIPQFANLSTQLTGAQTSTDKAIQDAIANDQAAQAGVQTAFFTGQNAVVPGFQKNLQGELATDQGQVNSYNQALSDLLTQENSANPSISGLKSSIDAYNKALASGPPKPGGIPTVGNAVSPGGLPGIPGHYSNTPINIQDLVNPTNRAQPTLAEAATQKDIDTQKALETLLGESYKPSFDSTGVTTFQSPGSAPTIQSLIDPILQNLTPQVAGANPNVFQHGSGGISPNVNYIQNINDAISALQKYLGENHLLPGSPPDKRPVGFTNPGAPGVF